MTANLLQNDLYGITDTNSSCISVTIYNTMLVHLGYNKYLIDFLYFLTSKLRICLEACVLEKNSTSSEQKNKYLASMGFMRRVYDVHAPCQWQKNCFNGKCPALIHAAGNLYCAREKT